MSYTFLPNELSKEINLHSTGAFNQDGQTAKSQRIGINIDGYQYFVSVIDKEYFRQMALLYVDINKPDGYPPYDPNYQAYTPFPLISVAHAGLFDFDITDYVFEAIKLAIGLALPIDEGKGLAMQIYYAATGSDNFDPLELTLNAIGVLTVIPIAKPLLPVVKVLNKVLVPLNKSNPKFIKSIGGVMGKVADELMDNKYDTLWTLMPFLLIAGEMALDEEAREGLTILVKSIASSDDLLAWMEYLSLPADGWEGNGEPPPVDLTASYSQEHARPYFSPSNGVMGVAYAGKNFTARRIAGLILGKSLYKLAQMKQLKNNPQVLSSVVGDIAEQAAKQSTSSFRKLLFKAGALKVGVALARKASNGLKSMIRGDDKARIDPKLLMASIIYLEYQMDNDLIFANGTEEDKNSLIELRELYARMFLPGGNGKKYGARFHLVQIAYRHLLSKTGSFPKVKAIESTRPIHFVEDAIPYKRGVDIILEDNKGKEIWLELKSFEKPFDKKRFGAWKYRGRADRTSHIHKEFYSDYLELKNDNDDVGENPDLAKIMWRFQEFDTKKVNKKSTAKSIKGPDIAYLKSTFKLHNYLCASAKSANEDEILNKTGLTKKALKASCNSSFYNIVDVNDTMSFIEEFVNNGLFEDIGDFAND
ncbi:hypothetical protein [Pseudoalteromonas sp. T1lg24]|uniref:hypothetical protein n=1 Tax=Pseudoalteromonas sp. T1lg24 TaxID=2077099 RepID=UPI000CF6D93F|nr:hypothetical protein [Pseudoalteromonas sp. T1lg24]